MIEKLSLKINDCGLADYPSGGTLGPRTVPDYEIVWIERGNCSWEIDGKSHACMPGSVVLCTPGMIDTWHWDPKSMTRHGYLHFEVLGNTDIEFPLRRDCSGSDVLRPLLRHSVWLAGLDDDASDKLAAEALRQALTWFVEGPVTRSVPTTQGEMHPVLVRALRILGHKWGNRSLVPPSIQEWSTASGVSRGHLARVCRKELNVTPQELLRHLRLDQGLIWLGRTNLKIGKISEMCGFQSQFHFSRCFKEAYGTSPREMRKRLLAGGEKPLSRLVGMRRLSQIVG